MKPAIPMTPTNLRLDDQLCFAVYAASNQLTRAYRPLLEGIGLTYPQYLVMMVLWEGDDRPIHDIAARLQLTPHGLSPILRRLQDAGLLRRHVDEVDGRVVKVSLTRRGRELEDGASKAQHDVVQQTGLGGGDLAELREMLHDLVLTMVEEKAS